MVPSLSEYVRALQSSLENPERLTTIEQPCNLVLIWNSVLFHRFIAQSLTDKLGIAVVAHAYRILNEGAA